MAEWLQKCKSRFDLMTKLAESGQPILAVEIGVAEGRHAEHMLRLCPTMTLYMVDPWLNQPLSAWNDGGNRPQPEMDDWMRQAEERTRPYENRRVLLREYSSEAAKHFNSRLLDYVYIDGNHSYSAVVADIATWWPLVKPGGILAGHDYTKNPDKHVLGVVPAVNEFVAANNLKLYRMQADHDCSWAVRKPV